MPPIPHLPKSQRIAGAINVSKNLQEHLGNDKHLQESVVSTLLDGGWTSIYL